MLGLLMACDRGEIAGMSAPAVPVAAAALRDGFSRNGTLPQWAPTAAELDASYAAGRREWPRFPVALREGAGKTTVEAHCVSCHSALYILGQPPLNADAWRATVEKMIKAYGAIIDEPSQRTIVDYLNANYGLNHRLNESTTPSPSASDAGHALYQQHCMMCHQATGTGVVGTFPPLAHHLLKLARSGAAARRYLIAVVLNGLAGPVQIDGTVYHNVMPPLGERLTDDDIAQVLNNVLTAWDQGSELPAGWQSITPSDVAAERAHPITPQDVHAMRPNDQ